MLVAHLTAAATGSVVGSKVCFEIVVGRLVSTGVREGTEAGAMIADRGCVIAQRGKEHREGQVIETSNTVRRIAVYRPRSLCPIL